MTTRQIRRVQCRIRDSVNGLYESYLAGVVRGLETHDRAIDRVLATMPAQRPHDGVSTTEPSIGPGTVQRELKRRGDLGCARVREKLWHLQHFDPSPIGDRRATAG